MNTKKKVALTALVIFLILAVVGLTIGLVLVANQAVLKNNMHVYYEATNVSCSIDASAKSYTSASDEGTVVKIKDGDNGYVLDNKLVSIAADASDDNATSGVLDFNEAQLTASGRVVFSFTIKNTAANSSAADLAVNVRVSGTSVVANTTIDEVTYVGNVKVQVGKTYDEAKVAEHFSQADSFVELSNIAQSDADGESFVVVLSVADPSVAADLTASISIEITQAA